MNFANPVLSPQPGQWDGFTTFTIAVLWDGAEFKMWYGASDVYQGPASVGYATIARRQQLDQAPGQPPARP